ncbi:hypothetical protein [Turicibacter sanguinis]|nr:hypothetical protein [Turicibacter sanguinis]
MLIIEGILELVTSLTDGGDCVYTIDLEDSTGKKLYDLLGEYEGKKLS